MIYEWDSIKKNYPKGAGNMKIALRKYKMLSDFKRVYEFLSENYQHPNWFNSPCAFEYSHTHGIFEYTNAHRFGIWEDDGEIVATACFEMRPGDYISCVKSGYEFLASDMLSYAEKELSKISDGKKSLEIFSTDCNVELFIENGYSIAWSEPMYVYNYDKGFRECKLPEGFSIISLEDENDIMKIDCCLHEGFNHGEWTEADNWSDGRLQMQSGPHFRKDLTTVIKAPNGDYACFAGMWIDEKNKYAYLEPLATRPKYRRMGLAEAAVMEAMMKTVPFGAKYCYCGSIEFYKKIGCEQVGQRNIWRKEW
jgi:predicted N-acetyltransferase YhbS